MWPTSDAPCAIGLKTFTLLSLISSLLNTDFLFFAGAASAGQQVDPTEGTSIPTVIPAKAGIHPSSPSSSVTIWQALALRNGSRPSPG